MKTRIKLVVFDLDDTLTTGPTIWELVHKENQTWTSHGIPYYEAFKKGEFGFNAFLRKDVASWAGLKLPDLKKVINKVKYLPGLKKTITALKNMGIKTAIVSSGLELLARKTAEKFGLNYYFANSLKIKNKRLTGEIRLLVPGKGKGRIIKQLKKKFRLKKKQILAVGDSHFDWPMFRESGYGVSFSDAPADLKRTVDFVISKKNIDELVAIISGLK